MIYTVVFNSVNKFGSPTTNSDLTFAFDWGVLQEDTKYKLTFSFTSRQLAVGANTVCMVYTNLGSPNTYEASTQVASKTSNFLGVLNIDQTSGANRLYSNASDNVPVLLQSRPSNSLFNVQLRGHDGNLYTASSGSVPDYVLTLNFEVVD